MSLLLSLRVCKLTRLNKKMEVSQYNLLTTAFLPKHNSEVSNLCPPTRK